MKKARKPPILDERLERIITRGLKKEHRSAIRKPVAMVISVSFEDIFEAIRKASL